MNNTLNANTPRTTLKLCLLGLVAGTVLLAGTAKADTTINSANSPYLVTDMTNAMPNLGVVTLTNGTLNIYPSYQAAPPIGYTITNAIILAGTANTLGFKNNDAKWALTGPVSASNTANQILSVVTGGGGSAGDREDVLFASPIPDGAGATVGLSVTLACFSGPEIYVNLSATNTFTGPITLIKGGSLPLGYLVIGGEKYMSWPALTRFNIPGAGSLGAGNYSNSITLGANTGIYYDSSANQVLSGPISGPGSLVKDVAGSTLTLSGTNTYTGTTTVTAGSLVLAANGSLKFAVTASAANKVTGAGAATFNGAFSIDTSAITAYSGSWTLVDVASRTYGAGFNVAGFTGSGGVWTNQVGVRIWTFNQATGLLTLSSVPAIIAFGITGHPGIINQTAKTIALAVPVGTPLASLAPTFTLTSGACNQSSGTPPSPTFAVQNPATYTVSGGGVTNTYAVTVTVTRTIEPWINVNMDNVTRSSLAGPGGGSTGYWNQMIGTPAAYAGVLSDAGGAATTVGYKTTAFDGIDAWGSPSLLLLNEGLRTFNPAATWTLTLTNLPVRKYHLHLASANCLSSQKSWGSFTTANSTDTAVPQIVSNTNGINGSTWQPGNNYVEFANIVPDASSNITITVTQNGTNRAPLSGFQVVDAGALAGNAAITSFIAGGYPGAINQDYRTIWVGVPGGTDLGVLAPTYTLTSGACTPASGAPPSPSFAVQNPATYTVIDGTTTNRYTVTIITETGVVWNAGSGDWDTSSVNWIGVLTGSPMAFFNGANAVFNNDSGGTITIAPDILAGSVTVGGSGIYGFTNGPLDFGSLTKTSSGTLELLSPNAYSGGTIVSGGALTIGSRTALGSGPVTLAGGTTFQQKLFEGNSAAGSLANAFFLSGGNVTLNIPFGTYKDIWFGNTVSGPGGLIIQGGTRIVTLAVSNSFSGGVNIISGNRVTVLDVNGLGNYGPLTLTNGAMANLLYVGDHAIPSLTLGGVPQPNGQYGSSVSGALNANDAYFSGTGTVTVGPATSGLTPPVLDPSTGYAIVSGKPSLTFTTVAGNYYRLVHSANVAAPLSTPWLPVVNAPTTDANGWALATTTSMTLVDPAGTTGAAQRFYLIEGSATASP